MKNTTTKYTELSWQQVLNGYSMGIFPMGNENDTISWYETSPRAILPIELPTSNIKIPRSLSQVLKKNIFEIRIDTSFEKVMLLCADRESTWINKLILNAFVDLHKRGLAHSVEAWESGKLVGGLYGVAYKGAFFGESMFHLVSNASKAAVVSLYKILKKNNYILFDIQMMTSHFELMGAIEISKKGYLEILDRAMEVERVFKV
jgi:leucyl/phenylalanyl-tRNA---protein transferase